MMKSCNFNPIVILLSMITDRHSSKFPKKSIFRIRILTMLFFVAGLLFSLPLTGCAPDAFTLMPVLPKPLQNEEQVAANKSQVLLPEGKGEKSRWNKAAATTQIFQTPTVKQTAGQATSEKTVVPVPDLRGKPLSVNFRDMPLPAFINHVYGDILDLSFTLPPELKDKKDLVTLRSKADITPAELYALATEIIAQYGIKITLDGKLLHFSLTENRPDEIPLLISGRTLPEVPVSHRPIFQLVELHVVSNTMVAQWLRIAFKDQPLEIFESPMRNAILLKGDRDLVRLALEMITVLDQPHMRGRYSFRVDPVFLGPSALASQLTKILTAEGISVNDRNGAVILIPVVDVNALLVFAADETMLKHVRHWITSLDKPGEMAANGDGRGAGIFSYQVRNTTADAIAEVLNNLLGGFETAPKKSSVGKGGGAADKNVALPEKNTGKIIIDEGRNMILFQGTSAEWNQMLPVIHSMDKMDRMVLLEVIIAEITLDNNEDMGINWSVKAGDTSFGTAPLSGEGSGGLPLGGNGFSYVLDTAGGVFARLNAYAEEKKLSILSTPRLMVKNGTEASMEVGKEVPFVTRAVSSTNVTSGENPGTGIVSETQYMKTGILLTVTPTIFSGNRIQLEISQQASETVPDNTNDTSSPSIFNRQINTTLTLKDGASVLLGGLITTHHSNSEEGIPWLKDLPLVGGLFRVSGAAARRTELVMMIIPYIVGSDAEAKKLTRAYLDRLSYRPGRKHSQKTNLKSN